MRENPSASVADVREFTLDLFGTALPNFTDLTETLACDLFDEIAEECGFEGERARLYDTTDYQVVEDKVRYFARFLADDDPERFKCEVADVTRYFCKRAAFDNMIENCRAQKVKWARMPTGLETCPFCFMLSSRGFVYASEKTASEGHHGYHDNCDCVPVPGFQDAKGNPRVKIDGYDPETMYRNWQSCEKSIGGRSQAREEWLALPDNERRSYIERHGNASKAFARFEQNRIRNEVATRDWHWLYTGQSPKVDVSLIDVSKLNDEQRRAYDKELNCANALARSGFRIAMTDNPLDKHKRGIPKFDYAIGGTGTSWEAKCPEGSGYLAVAGNIAKADTKFLKIGHESRIVMSNLDSDMSDKQFWDYFEESLSDPKSDYSNISQILFVFKDGTVKRWHKK